MVAAKRTAGTVKLVKPAQSEAIESVAAMTAIPAPCGVGRKCEDLAFGLEIVALHHAADVAFVAFFQAGPTFIRRENILRLGNFTRSEKRWTRQSQTGTGRAEQGEKSAA